MSKKYSIAALRADDLFVVDDESGRVIGRGDCMGTVLSIIGSELGIDISIQRFPGDYLFALVNRAADVKPAACS